MTTNISTDARDIVLHYLKIAEKRATPAIMARSVSQMKKLLESGYTKDEAIEVLDYVILEKKIDVYSLGYLNTCINDVLHELERKKAAEVAQQQRYELNQKVLEQQASSRDEVKVDDESTERNRAKLRRRTGIQSRVGKKFNFDMFEGD